MTTMEIRSMAKKMCSVAEGVLFRTGPFLKEGVYRDLMLHEMEGDGMRCRRELVFNCAFNDSKGGRVVVGNGQCMRSDIELPDLGGVLEFKSSTTPTRQEATWQLRNYIEQRPDLSWGLIICFVSKFGSRTAPYVQCDCIIQTPDTHTVTGSNNEEYKLGVYLTETFKSHSYPYEGELFRGFDV